MPIVASPTVVVDTGPIVALLDADEAHHEWARRQFDTLAAPLLTCEADYYRYRADLMVRHDEGLTRTYNRFHDPDETDPEIATFRDLHAAMDRVVRDADGWTDVPTDCAFLLDYAIDEEAWGTRKKPFR